MPSLKLYATRIPAYCELTATARKLHSRERTRPPLAPRAPARYFAGTMRPASDAFASGVDLITYLRMYHVSSMPNIALAAK